MKQEVLDFIVCPSCRGALILIEINTGNEFEVAIGILECKNCKTHFGIIDGIPVLKVKKQESINVDYEQHAKEFNREYKKISWVKSQDDLDSLKVNPELTKNSTRMQISTLYEYGNLKKSKILDVGCGFGFDLKRIWEKCQNCLLFGIDVSEITLKRAQENNTPAFLSVAFAESLPYTDNFFDNVISHEALEHVINPGMCLAEMGRVLKENGRIIISTPNGKGFFSAFIEPAKLKLKKILGRNIIKRYKDSPVRVPEIEKICDHLGLRIGSVVYTCPFYFLGNSITEHMPVSISKMITKLIVRYSDRLAKLPLINVLICDEMTIIIEKPNN